MKNKPNFLDYQSAYQGGVCSTNPSSSAFRQAKKACFELVLDFLPKHGPAPIFSLAWVMASWAHLWCSTSTFEDSAMMTWKGKKTTNGWNPHTFLYTTTHIAHALPKMLFVVECVCRLFPAFLSPTNPNRHLYIYIYRCIVYSVLPPCSLQSWSLEQVDIRRGMQLAESLKTRNHKKNPARGVSAYYRLFWGYPQKPLWIETTFWPPKPPLRGCSKQNNPCLPAVGDYSFYQLNSW